MIPMSTNTHHLAENLKAETVTQLITPSMNKLIDDIHLSFECPEMFFVDVAIHAIEHGKLLTW